MLYLRVIGGTNFSFTDEWTEYISQSFYFRVWDLTREIRENKNPAKISTYTVCCHNLLNKSKYIYMIILSIKHQVCCNCCDDCFTSTVYLQEAEARGEDYDRLKLLDVSAEEAERWEQKKKKKNPDQGFSGMHV